MLHPPTGGFQQLLLEPMLKFHYMLKELRLHEEEYVLMQAISLFSPGGDPTAAQPPCPRPRLAPIPSAFSPLLLSSPLLSLSLPSPL